MTNEAAQVAPERLDELIARTAPGDLLHIDDEADMNAALRELQRRRQSDADAAAERWQPIETAPRDGTPVDLWHRVGTRMCEVWWDADDKCWSNCSDDSDYTHWMPCPAPPTAKQGDV